VESVNFSFGVTRDFTANTDPLRHETVDYWIVLEGGTTHYFDENSGLLGDNSISSPLASVFGSEQFTSSALVGDNNTITWRPQDLSEYPAGDYNVYAYIKDNAGNIRKSEVKTITLTDEYYFYQAPVGNAIEIITEHFDASTGGLPHFVELDNDGLVDDEVFYLNASDNGEVYYNTQGTIGIKFTVSEIQSVISEMVIDASILGLGEITVQASEFDDTNKDYTWVIDLIDPNFEATAQAGVYVVGDNNYANIPVTLYDTLGNPINSTWKDNFKLEIPPIPDWGTITGDLTLNVDKSVISPGNPLWSYNADTNPANDDDLSLSNIGGATFDSNVISYHIPYSNDSNSSWELKLTNSNNSNEIIRSGNIAQNGPSVTDDFAFYGYDETNFQLFVGREETADISVSVSVTPEALADDGYVIPDSFSDAITFTIDNTNPEFMGLTDGFIDTTNNRVVTENDDVLTFNVQTSEVLSDEIDNDPYDSVNTGWSVYPSVINKETEEEIVFDNPVTAHILNVTTSDNLNFEISVKINDLNGDWPDMENNLDALLVLRAPNDAAGNPGKYNDPVYPLHADVFWQDGMEAYVDFKIQNSKPVITRIQLENYKSTTIATYDGGSWNSSITQGYVNDDPGSEVTIAALVEGGAYNRSLTSFAYADLSEVDAGATQVEGIWYNYTTDLYNQYFDGQAPTEIPGNVAENNMYIVVWTHSITANLTNNANANITLTKESADINSSVWTFAIPADYANRVLTFDAFIFDNVNNNDQAQKIWDIGNVPTVTNVDIDNISVTTTNDFLKNGQNAEVTFNLTDIERIESVIVSLNTETTENDITLLPGEFLQLLLLIIKILIF